MAIFNIFKNLKIITRFPNEFQNLNRVERAQRPRQSKKLTTVFTSRILLEFLFNMSFIYLNTTERFPTYNNKLSNDPSICCTVFQDKKLRGIGFYLFTESHIKIPVDNLIFATKKDLNDYCQMFGFKLGTTHFIRQVTFSE